MMCSVDRQIAHKHAVVFRCSVVVIVFFCTSPYQGQAPDESDDEDYPGGDLPGSYEKRDGLGFDGASGDIQNSAAAVRILTFIPKVLCAGRKVEGGSRSRSRRHRGGAGITGGEGNAIATDGDDFFFVKKRSLSH